MSITPEMARAELAKRKLASNSSAITPEMARAELERRKSLQKKEPLNYERAQQLMGGVGSGVTKPGSPAESLESFNFGEAWNRIIQDPNKRLTGEVLTSIFAPELRAASKLGSLGKIGAESLKQGGIAALFNPEARAKAGGAAAGITAPFVTASEMILSSNPSIKFLGKLLRGGAAGAVGAEAGSEIAGTPGGLAGGALASILATKAGKKGALREAASDIKKARTPQSDELSQYAKDIGLKYLTPAEATGNQALAAMQGRVARDVEGSKALYAQGEQRLLSEKDAFNNLLDVIYNPKKFDKLKSINFEKAFEKQVPKQFLNKWLDNEVVQQAIIKAERQPIYRERLKGVEPDTVEYWDNIREILYNIEKAQPPGSPMAGRYNELRNNVIGEIDEVIPTYKKGRSLSELKHTRDDLVKAFDDAKIRGSEISKFLLKDKKYDDLQKHLRNNPEASELVRKWREVTKNLINPVTPKTAAGYATTGMYESRNSQKALDMITEKLTEHFKGRPDSVALAELLTNPNWQTEIEKILQLTEREKLFAKALKKGGAGLSQIGGSSMSEQ